MKHFLLGIACLCALLPQPAFAEDQPSTKKPELRQAPVLKPWTGDLDGMYKNEWETVATFSVLDASNFASVWTSTTLGVNWFIHHSDIRVTANYTFNNNVSGMTGQWENVARLQTQFAW